jgi:U3 small nucleolar RNA-associated protein 7
LLLLQAVEVGAGRKVFDLQLDQLGPYSIDFNRSGRHMLLAGRKGHLALMDWQRRQLICEVQVGKYVDGVGVAAAKVST